MSDTVAGTSGGGQNAALVAGNYLEIPFSTTIVAPVATTDVGNYTYVSIQILTQGTGSSIAFQGSNDGVNWAAVSLTRPDGSGSNATSTTTTNTQSGPLAYRYFRLNVTGISAGTTAGIIEFTSMPRTPVLLRAVITDGATPLVVKPASTLAASTDGSVVVQQSPMRADASNLAVTILSAANTGATLTLPAGAAGLFHYITAIDIRVINPTATGIAASTTTLTWTTTNLPGSIAWDAGTLLAAGDWRVVAFVDPTTPIKSSVAATQTTIVAPAIGTGGVCRMTVNYYTAP